MSFPHQLKAFNLMYGLPVNPFPANLGTARLQNLKDILLKEVSEIDEIIQQSEMLDQMAKLQAQHEAEGEEIKSNAGELTVKMLANVADLMGDLQVYCGSEMVKWGLPIEATLYIIMASNASKLGADGLPMVNDQGKVEKGPNYWKPEPLLEKLLTMLPLWHNSDAVQLAKELVAAKQHELRQGHTYQPG